MLRQDNIIPLYEQLMEIIEQEIHDGKYKPGDRIMTESELSKFYGVSLITVRKAISLLTEKGILIKKQGKGTFVKKPKLSRSVRRLSGFTQLCLQTGMVPGGKMLENSLIEANEKIASRLGVPEGSRIVYISRLRYADGDPVIIEKNYFPLKYVKLLNQRFDNESIFAYLKEKMNIVCKESEKSIELCRATPEEAALLEIKRGDNMMYVKSTAYDQSHEIIYAGIQLINGDRYTLNVYEVSQDD